MGGLFQQYQPMVTLMLDPSRTYTLKILYSKVSFKLALDSLFLGKSDKRIGSENSLKHDF